MVRIIAILASGALLAGCSSWSVPSFDTSILRGSSSGSGVSVRIESSPSGAEARAPAGSTCRTPCTLDLPVGTVSNVTFALQGYLPQSVQVTVSTTPGSADLTEAGVAQQVTIDPNPIFAQLEMAPPPPPPARRRAAPPKPRPQAQQPAPPPPPAQGFGPPPGQPGFR